MSLHKLSPLAFLDGTSLNALKDRIESRWLVVIDFVQFGGDGLVVVILYEALDGNTVEVAARNAHVKVAVSIPDPVFKAADDLLRG